MSEEPTFLMKTWRRDDNNHLIHDGDCHFWDRRVCTCGLLHHLRPMSGVQLDLMPDFYKEDGAQLTIMEGLLGSDLVKAADAIMNRPDRPLTAEEEKEFDALIGEVGFIETKDNPPKDNIS